MKGGAFLAWSVAWGALAAATLAVPGFGVPLWHYTAAFAVLAALAAWRWRAYLASPPLLGAHLLASGALAVATGFVLLYGKDAFKASGTKDWAKFWHCLVSMWFLYVSVAHLARPANARAVATYSADTRRARRRLALHVAAWTLTVVVLVANVLARDAFTDANYLYLSSLTVLVSTAIAYGAWIVWKVRTGQWTGAGPRPGGTRALRGNIDLMLLGWSGLAQGSGLVLLYAKEFLHGNGYKYVSKFWHTAPSVVVTLLLVAHVVLTLPLLRAYWLGRKAAKVSGA